MNFGEYKVIGRKFVFFFFWPLGGTRNEKLTQNRLSGDKKTNIPPK